MTPAALDKSARSRFRQRLLLAGPVVLLTSVAIVCGGALWLPPGGAGINHLMLPLVLFPAIWTGLFFHASLDRSLFRIYAIHGALLSVNAVMILPHLI